MFDYKNILAVQDLEVHQILALSTCMHGHSVINGSFK
jgi:hypothetical protein